MDWLKALLTEQSIAQAVLIYGLVIATGIWFGRIKIAGVSLGITWILFIGILLSFFGISVDKEIAHFLREFGLILFVYSIGLQVGPGFFASLKKSAFSNNILAASVVLLGVLTTVILFYISGFHISILSGIMSGAVTNTPGLAAAQSALKDLQPNVADSSFMTLAYAVTYPFGVFGIILSLLLLKNLFKTNIKTEQELHRKLNVIRSRRPLSMHFRLENRMMIGQPLRTVFSLLKHPVVVSRMNHNGTIITPTPDTVLSENDVLLIVAPKEEIEQVKLLIGPVCEANLKDLPESNLVSKTIVVTRKEITHKRLGDIPELHQNNFTLTRLNRAGIEMIPHGGIVLQLADTIRVVGTE